MVAGVQLIYRLTGTVRLYIDPVVGVDYFNFYWKNSATLPFVNLLGKVENVASLIPSSKGKIVFEFAITDTLVTAGWDNNKTNYVSYTEVIGGVEGAQKGPIVIPVKYELHKISNYSVSLGFNTDEQKFIPIAVDPDGKVKTVP